MEKEEREDATMNLQRVITVIISSAPLDVKNDKDILNVATVAFDIPPATEEEAVLIAIETAARVLTNKIIHKEENNKGTLQ